MEKYSLINEEPVIRTRSGKFINVFNPNPDDIVIEDIAHCLSMQCRFGGHLPVFYSVAQHSVMCSLMVPEEYALEALLHDASEAYLLDMPSPIKHGLTNYKDVETALQKVIAAKFGIPLIMSDIVKAADNQCLLMEWNGMMISSGPYLEVENHYWSMMRFMQRFNELTNEKAD